MSAPKLKERVTEKSFPVTEPLHKMADGHGSYAWDVYRQDEKGVAPALKYSGPNLDGSEHLSTVVRIGDDSGNSSLKDGNDLVTSVAHHDDYFGNPRCLEEPYHALYKRLPADLDQRLELFHAGGQSCRRDNGGDGEISHGHVVGLGVR